jgi:hypothetical protein
MKVKIYKQALLVLIALAAGARGFAQETTATQKSKVFNEKEFQQKMDDLGKNLEINLKDIGKNLAIQLNDIAPKINIEINDLVKNINEDVLPKINTGLNNIDLNIDNDENDLEHDGASVKVKNYSKSYPIDGNDKIKLSNQYGRIAISTWDRNEVKVDVQVKAQANDDATAQKLLDGVQIRDSKEGDLVSFRTTIEPNSNGSWKIWNWGDNKKHKLEINYTVYMPAKTDLNVEDSYGAIVLPDLQGKVKISSSYGSVDVQNLSNPANEIEGSYGSLKAGNLNGGRLEFSYGSVNLEECNNLKADLSYGSFKLGKLKGTADFDLSYVGGFKIEEMGSTFKKLNINSSYSGVSLGVPGNNNFDFDITTNYGGFNYNDDKVTITSKTPADGSKHYSSTKNYKGHFGKSGSDADVNIHSTFGSVNFE